jgi:hypothetical protein
MSAAESEALGLARDGDRVVIDLRNYRFPSRCLITDEPVEGDHLPLAFYSWGLLLLRSEIADEVKDAVRSEWGIGPLRVMNLAIRTPLKGIHRKRSSVPGFCLLASGIAIFSLGAILAVVGFIAWQWPAFIISIPLVVGAVLCLAGVRLLTRQHSPLSIRRFRDGFVWLGGVHPGIRDMLPAWQNSAAAIAHQSRMARSRLALGGVLLTIGLVYTFFQYENARDAVSSPRWPSIVGTVTSSEVTTRTVGGARNGPRRTEFEVQVNYSFSVGGVGYSGSRIGFHRPPGFISRESAKGYQQQYYRVGNPITVCYSAEDPSRCTLTRAPISEILTLTVPMAAALVLGSGFFIAGAISLRKAIPDSSHGVNGNS